MDNLIKFLEEKDFTEEAINLKKGGDILNLSKKRLTDKDVKEISKLLASDNNIIQLDLFGNNISTDGAMSLRNCLSLIKLLLVLTLGITI
ncbi:MAG: hypothetical protein LN567_00205 [Rickettsia endosymbiont of Graphium doson]|nr:hypothetical protein [Rickettsia endosymbiont of Graphium doson]